MEKVAIILLNYNGYADTIECIKSIKEKTSSSSFEYEIIVVDNKSTNDSVEKLKSIESIKLIEAKENGGFAAGNNIGIEYALKNKADYVLLLNNDTIITKNSIEKMYLAIKEHDDLGIVSARIMFYDEKNKINCCGGSINYFKGTASIKNKGKIYKDKKENFFYTKFTSGCCMLIKREVFEEVGYLPEEYFMYYEDVDFCVRVQKAGFKIGICVDSVIYHKESASSGGNASPFAIQWNTRNRLVFINKYKCYGLLTKMFFYTTRIVVAIKYKFKKQYDSLEALKVGIKKGREYINNEKNKNGAKN